MLKASSIATMITRKSCQTLVIDVSNFPLLTRLVVKELIESSMKHNRMLDASDSNLKNFFSLLENMLLHGIKWRNGILSGKKDLWSILETIDRDHHDSFSVADIVWQISNIKTSIGKCRAWLRFAFVQKHLSDSFKRLIEKKDLLKECYDPSAFVLSEDAFVVAGYLVGLNIIDLTWYAKDEDLDNWNVPFDFRPYLRDIRESGNRSIGNGEIPSNIELVLDQKNYLEELNRNLNLKIIAFKRRIAELEDKPSQYFKNTTENTATDLSAASSEEPTPNQQDKANSEEEKCETSKDELDPAVFLLSQEKEKRFHLEENIKSLVASLNEKEATIKLLEKDIREKQDTIISLGKQIKDIKSVNSQLSNKMRECEEGVKTKLDQINRLENRNNVLDETLCQMSTKVSALEKSRLELEQTNERLRTSMTEKDQKRAALESDFRKEKEHKISLQSIVDEQQEQITSLMSEVEEFRSSASDLVIAREEVKRLKFKCSEYELSLEEIGAQLKDCKLETESLKETTGIAKEAHWARDQDADNCSRCNRLFSVAWRKHHCRNCGNIFCGPCSDNKLPLPSSSKPVRVCEGCHIMLLDRYSAS